MGNMVLPVSMGGNLYLYHATPSTHELAPDVYKEKAIQVILKPQTGEVQIQYQLPKLLENTKTELVTTELLGKTYHANMQYEAPDASPYVFDLDYYGVKRSRHQIMPGPFELSKTDEAQTFYFS